MQTSSGMDAGGRPTSGVADARGTSEPVAAPAAAPDKGWARPVLGGCGPRCPAWSAPPLAAAHNWVQKTQPMEEIPWRLMPRGGRAVAEGHVGLALGGVSPAQDWGWAMAAVEGMGWGALWSSQAPAPPPHRVVGLQLELLRDSYARAHTTHTHASTCMHTAVHAYTHAHRTHAGPHVTHIITHTHTCGDMCTHALRMPTDT